MTGELAVVRTKQGAAPPSTFPAPSIGCSVTRMRRSSTGALDRGELAPQLPAAAEKFGTFGTSPTMRLCQRCLAAVEGLHLRRGDGGQELEFDR